MDLFTEHYAHRQRALLDDDIRRAELLGPHLPARRRLGDRLVPPSLRARRRLVNTQDQSDTADGHLLRPMVNHLHAPAALGLAVALSIGAGASGSAGNDPAGAPTARPTHKLHAVYEQQPPTIGTPVCSPGTSCVIPFALLGTSTGDLEGTTAQAGAASRLPDGSLYANSTLVFTGTVAGCGTGTVTMRSTGFNRGGVTSGSIEIIEGSGTGDLARLRGTGSVISGEANGTSVARGQIEYKVKC